MNSGGKWIHVSPLGVDVADTYQVKEDRVSKTKLDVIVVYLFFRPQQTVAYDTFDLKLGLFGVVGCCIRFSTADFVMIATYLLISPMLVFFMLSYVLNHLATLVAL